MAPAGASFRWTPIGALLLLSAILVLTACSDEKEDGAARNVAPVSTSVGQLASRPQDVERKLASQPALPQPLGSRVVEPNSEGVLTLEASAGQFSPNNLRIRVGEPATIRLANRDATTHSLRIAGVDGRFETEDDGLIVPSEVEAGETGELQFAPQIPGPYVFRCDFHKNQMGGQITAQ